jgi:hypothetical protein
MNKLRFLLAMAALAALTPPLAGQQKRISPHETIISKVINADRVIVVYGRLYTKDPDTGQERRIWGGLIPFGEIWRTGADEATLLITQKTIVLGQSTVPAGAYTLWTFPSEDGTAKLTTGRSANWESDPGLMT